jgi:hypothetical protein
MLNKNLPAYPFVIPMAASPIPVIYLKLLEQGTDLRHIQALPGHSSGKTTEIYSLVSHHGLEKIISSLDRLNI